MFYATTARSLIRKAPQQIIPRGATRSVTTTSSESFAFYPVQRNRVVASKKTSGDSFAFYPSQGSDRAAYKASKADAAAAAAVASTTNTPVVVATTKRAPMIASSRKVTRKEQTNWDTIAVQFLEQPQTVARA